ncbi:hypothetical protein C8R44DRAFT_904589, partial [Mycena epipterygia]
MAELALGFIGAAATVGAATLATGSGFTGRHESSYREEMLDTRWSTDDFIKNLQSGEVAPDEEIEFWKTRDEAIRRENDYHDSIESYKDASWINPLDKIKKKKAVRRAKRSTRQSNHSLRNLNESIHSGSDTSSICASSGSPPGSNLAVDDLQNWRFDVYEASAVHVTDSDSSSSAEDEPAPFGGDASSLESVLRCRQRQPSAEVEGDYRGDQLFSESDPLSYALHAWTLSTPSSSEDELPPVTPQDELPGVNRIGVPFSHSQVMHNPSSVSIINGEEAELAINEHFSYSGVELPSWKPLEPRTKFFGVGEMDVMGMDICIGGADGDPWMYVEVLAMFCEGTGYAGHRAMSAAAAEFDSPEAG